MTAIVAWVVPQKFVHLATRNADLMKIMWIVADSAFVVLIRMIPVVVVAMIVVMVAVVMIIVMSGG